MKHKTPDQRNADAARARMMAVFNGPSTSAERVRAAWGYRYASQAVHDRHPMPSEFGTYNLSWTDFAGHAAGACRVLVEGLGYEGGNTPRAKAKAVMRTLDWQLGYRWSWGVDCLLIRLRDREVSPARCDEFAAQGGAFGERLGLTLLAVENALREKQPQAALLNARIAAGIALEEAARLAGWLEVASDPNAIDLTWQSISAGRRYLDLFDAQQGTGTKKGHSRNRWG